MDRNDDDYEKATWTPMESNPRTIILKLGKMRNQDHLKFKTLNFSVEGNSYANQIQKMDFKGSTAWIYTLNYMQKLFSNLKANSLLSSP